jgi:hypothetical protein
MRIRLSELKTAGLKPINIYNAWLRRHLYPLRARAHLMCEDTGLTDPTRMLHVEWELDKYIQALDCITTSVFKSFNKPLVPYTTANVCPTVRNRFFFLLYLFQLRHSIYTVRNRFFFLLYLFQLHHSIYTYFLSLSRCSLKSGKTRRVCRLFPQMPK